jgi:hypothetical protein
VEGWEYREADEQTGMKESRKIRPRVEQLRLSSRSGNKTNDKLKVLCEPNVPSRGIIMKARRPPTWTDNFFEG